MKKDLGQAPLTLGGWLIFLGWGLLGGLINLIGNFDMKPYVIAGEIFTIIPFIIIVFIFVVTTFFLKRHKAFPVTFIIMESLYILLNIVCVIFTISLQSVRLNVYFVLYFIVPIVIGTLWIIYVLRSERVNKTFVFSWNEKPVQRLVDKANGSASESI